MSENFEAIKTAAEKHMAELKVPGIASNDLFSFKFEKKTEKLYPLDKDAVYA